MAQWEGNKIVGMAPGQTGGSGSEVEAPPPSTPSTSPVPKQDDKISTYTDPFGNVHVVEDYSSQGGGKYDTVVSGFQGGYSGSGFERMGAATLGSRSVQADILAEAGASDTKARELEAAGIIKISRTGVMEDRTPGIRQTLYEGQTQPSIFGAAKEYREQNPGEFIPFVTKDAVTQRKEKILKEVLPPGIELSDFSRDVFNVGRGAGDFIRGISIDDRLFSGSGAGEGMISGKSLFGNVQESLARIPEFIGIIPGTVEIFGKAAVKDPFSIPKMAVVGTVMTAGGIAEQAEEDPLQFASDLLVSAAVFKGSGKAARATSDTFRFAGKQYVPPEAIIEPQILSGAERFPTAPRGTGGADLLAEFKTGKYRLPGTEGKIGAWHATPEEFAAETMTQVGTSEGKGLYVAPSTSPHFWKLDKGFKLFGFDNPPETPAGLWIELEGIKRSPPNTRLDIAAQNKFFTEEAPKGTAFISSAFEKGTKLEKEAIIPPDTPLTRVRDDQFTLYKGKKVPLMEYTAKNPLAEPPESWPFDFTGGEHSISVKRGSNGMVLVSGVAALGTPAGAQETIFEDLSKQQMRISKEYAEYQEPIFTPESLLSGITLRSPKKSDISKKAAIDLNTDIMTELKSGGMEGIKLDKRGNVVKQPKEFDVQATDEVLVEADYFNKAKVEKRVEHRKNVNFGTEDVGIYTLEDLPKRAAPKKDFGAQLIDTVRSRPTMSETVRAWNIKGAIEKQPKISSGRSGGGYGSSSAIPAFIRDEISPASSRTASSPIKYKIINPMYIDSGRGSRSRSIISDLDMEFETPRSSNIKNLIGTSGRSSTFSFDREFVLKKKKIELPRKKKEKDPILRGDNFFKTPRASPIIEPWEGGDFIMEKPRKKARR